MNRGHRNEQILPYKSSYYKALPQVQSPSRKHLLNIFESMVLLQNNIFLVNTIDNTRDFVQNSNDSHGSYTLICENVLKLTFKCLNEGLVLFNERIVPGSLLWESKEYVTWSTSGIRWEYLGSLVLPPLCPPEFCEFLCLHHLFWQLLCPGSVISVIWLRKCPSKDPVHCCTFQRIKLDFCSSGNVSFVLVPT